MHRFREQQSHKVQVHQLGLSLLDALSIQLQDDPFQLLFQEPLRVLSGAELSAWYLF